MLSKTRWVILNWAETIKLVQVLLQQLELFLIATLGYFIIAWIQKFYNDAYQIPDFVTILTTRIKSNPPS